MRDECGHSFALHTSESFTVGVENVACDDPDCGCWEYLEHENRCERCGGQDGWMCICYAR